MKEYSPEQLRVMKLDSRDWERFWRIMCRPYEVSLDDLRWAGDFSENGMEKFRDAMSLTDDLEQIMKLDLIFMGLFHWGYQLQGEVLFTDPRRN